jgi:hypothetical protein
LDWQRDGLGEPKGVKDATAGYRVEMDTLAAFFEDRCVFHPKAVVPATRLYKAYQEWCSESGETDESQRRFGGRLRERGYESFTYTAGPNKDRKGWRGIGLRDDRPDDGPGGRGPSPEQTVTADDQTRASGGERDQRAPDTPETGADRPQSGQTVDDCPHEESPISMGKTREGAEDADERGRKINKSLTIPPRVERLQKKVRKVRKVRNRTPSVGFPPTKRSGSNASSARG